MQGLYELLAPGSTVLKEDNNFYSITEPGTPQVKVPRADVEKFGTKKEKETPLAQYAERRPKTPTGRVTEDKITKHASDLRRKLEGDKKIVRRNQADDVSVVSSIRSNVSRALRVRVPVKPPRPPPPSPIKSQQQQGPSTSQQQQGPSTSQQQQGPSTSHQGQQKRQHQGQQQKRGRRDSNDSVGQQQKRGRRDSDDSVDPKTKSTPVRQSRTSAFTAVAPRSTVVEGLQENAAQNPSQTVVENAAQIPSQTVVEEIQENAAQNPSQTVVENAAQNPSQTVVEEIQENAAQNPSETSNFEVRANSPIIRQEIQTYTSPNLSPRAITALEAETRNDSD